jgi:outer membrane protein assembly factor BamB
VSRIDPATNTVVATIDGVGSGVGITAGDGDIFVGTRDGDISRIDPASNEARPVIDLDGWPYGLAYGDGELWATNANTGVVYRLNDALLDPSG